MNLIREFMLCTINYYPLRFSSKPDPLSYGSLGAALFFDDNLEIIHFFEILDRLDLLSFARDQIPPLNGMRFVPYYGCMLARPPALRHEKNYHGLIEKIMASLGATPVNWAYSSRCCGTFLTVARPDIVTPMVNDIIEGAVQASAMCHMNLEVRCSLKEKVPVLHFSEVLSLALGLGGKKQKGWFSRHLVDPRPMLKKIHLFR